MKILPLLLTAALFLPLAACTAPPPDPPPSAETQADTADLTAALIACQARLTELQAALLSVKEESFIQKTEYEARIRDLLEEIAALEARLALSHDPEPPTDRPVSVIPQQPPTDSPETERPATTAFHFEMRDGHAVIIAYLGDEPHVRVPAAIEGYPVTAIEENAFKSTSVVTVELPYSLTHIGWFAFADCQSLTSLTLPASVENIGYGAFDGCPHLTVICPADSYAARYAASFGLPHKEE
jgi:hypothetical protein